jgi:hypothetical protein
MFRYIMGKSYRPSMSTSRPSRKKFFISSSYNTGWQSAQFGMLSLSAEKQMTEACWQKNHIMSKALYYTLIRIYASQHQRKTVLQHISSCTELPLSTLMLIPQWLDLIQTPSKQWDASPQATLSLTNCRATHRHSSGFLSLPLLHNPKE